MLNIDIKKFLNQKDIDMTIREIYIIEKDKLDDEFQAMDNEIMISYIKAYIINEYSRIKNQFLQEKFLLGISKDLTIADIINDFMEKLNATKAKMGDLMYKDRLEELKNLEEYKDSKVYKELSKSDNEIARIIKEFGGYKTLKEIKKNAPKYPVRSVFSDYIISEEEIKVIEETKKYFMPNQMAHMMYDELMDFEYCCDHQIKSEDEMLKKILVNTYQDNPGIEIIFPDGIIVDYFQGDIRITPYTFKDVVEYTKLYFAAHYDEMIATDEEEYPSYEKGKAMIRSSFMGAIFRLRAYEFSYTQKMINDSTKEYEKIKETAKKYDL